MITFHFPDNADDARHRYISLRAKLCYLYFGENEIQVYNDQAERVAGIPLNDEQWRNPYDIRKLVLKDLAERGHPYVD